MGNEKHFFVLVGNTYEPKPKFEKKRGKEWVPYGHQTNEYAQYLIDLVQNSETHGSIISTKAKMISGDEIRTDSQDTKLFLENLNPSETIEELFYKWAWDLEVFGSYTINVLWNRTHDKISELHHIDNSRILWGVKNEDREVDTYFYSEDWNNYRKEEYQPKTIQKFLTSSENSEVVVSSPSYQAGSNYYTYPDYVAGIKSIETDAKIVDFNNSNIDNNFQPGKMITFIGPEPSEEEKQEIREQLESKHSGSLNAGRTMIAFAAEKDRAPIVEKIDTDRLDKMYDTLSESVRNRILFAHGITSPLLVGIRTPGSLGGGEELEEAKNLFYKYRILPKRNYILSNVNKLLKYNGLDPIYIIDDEDNNDDKKE